MNKRERIKKIAQSEEDQILLAKVHDRILAGIQRQLPAWTFFLSPREQQMVKSMFLGEDLHFFGGTQEPERAVCCWLPEYLEEDSLWDEEVSPICAVRASFYAADQLTHRDFLGSLMGCGIKRETVGDIFVGQGSCDFLVTREILPYLLQNLESAGRTRLHLSQIPLSDIQVPLANIRQVRSTVSSLRLDSIVSAGFGLSRGKAAEAIEAGRTALNDMPADKPDKTVCPGDKISLRGMGKIRLDDVGGKTRKDRLCIVISRYE